MKNARLKTQEKTIIEFRALGLDHGKIDKDKGVIHGVSLITSGVEARGHDLHTDEKTLAQICDLASQMGQVPVKWNHKTGADSINGYLCNFFVSGNKVKGDWHLLQTHPQYEHALELAERMPQNFGLSTAFLPSDPEARAGKKFARCEELLSVDLVAQPAANPGGLFESRLQDHGQQDHGAVDRSSLRKITLMNEPNPDPAQNSEPTLADLMEAIKGQNETIATLKDELASMRDEGRADQPLSVEELEELAQMDDAQLARLNITRDEVDQAVADAMAGGEGDPAQDVRGQRLDVRGEDEFRGGGENGGGFVASGARGDAAGAAAPPAVAAELQDLRRRVTRFERQQTLERQQEEATAIEEYFNAIEEKVVALEARNQALEVAFKAGGGKVSADGEFVMPKGKGGPATERNVTSFEDLVTAKVTELSAADPKLSPARARAAAIRFCQESNREEYNTHLKEKGVRFDDDED